MKRKLALITTITMIAALLLPAPALAWQGRLAGLLFDRPAFSIGPPEFKTAAFPDIADSRAEEEFTLLAALDILNNSRPQGVVTRAELTAIAVRLLGQEAVAAQWRDGVPPYDDAGEIPAWAKRYAVAAGEFKLIKGIPTPDGRLLFAANQPVRFRDAVTLMKRVIQEGYTSWPEEIQKDLHAALTIKLEGSDPAAGITREDMAILVVNTLRAGRYNQATGRLDQAESILNSRYIIREGKAELNGSGTALNIYPGDTGNPYYHEIIDLAARGFLRGLSSLDDLRDRQRSVYVIYNPDRTINGIVYIKSLNDFE